MWNRQVKQDFAQLKKIPFQTLGKVSLADFSLTGLHSLPCPASPILQMFLQLTYEYD